MPGIGDCGLQAGHSRDVQKLAQLAIWANGGVRALGIASGEPAIVAGSSSSSEPPNPRTMIATRRAVADSSSSRATL
jgi:hypothetical protein